MSSLALKRLFGDGVSCKALRIVICNHSQAANDSTYKECHSLTTRIGFVPTLPWYSVTQRFAFQLPSPHIAMSKERKDDEDIVEMSLRDDVLKGGGVEEAPREGLETLLSIEAYPGDRQISPLLKILDMESPSQKPRMLGFVQQPCSSAAEKTVRGEIADFIESGHLLGEDLKSASPLSLYFPDHITSEYTKLASSGPPFRFDLPASHGVELSSVAQRSLTCNSDVVDCGIVHATRHFTSAKVVEIEELPCGWEESLPKLSPAEAAANRWHRYQIRLRQKARIVNFMQSPEDFVIARRHMAPSRRGKPMTALPFRPRQSTKLDPMVSCKNTTSAIRHQPPPKGRRKNKDKMLELEQINAMLRNKVDRLFAEMGQIRDSSSAIPGAVASQLTSFGLARSGSVEGTPKLQSSDFVARRDDIADPKFRR
jgi:hypothetical protein